MDVIETFFVVEVGDMVRATAFYVRALGATVLFSSERWSSLQVAGARLGLALDPEHEGARVGLHFVVRDLDTARGDVERSGGIVASSPAEVAPGVFTVEVTDTEGNPFTLVQQQPSPGGP